jgi:hypothetical protein
VPDNQGGQKGPGYSELAMRNQFATWLVYMDAPAADPPMRAAAE